MPLSQRQWSRQGEMEVIQTQRPLKCTPNNEKNQNRINIHKYAIALPIHYFYYKMSSFLKVRANRFGEVK